MNKLVSILVLLSLWLGCWDAHSADTDSVRVSLLTCMPGPEIYALDGHSALRVQSSEGDNIWNYGIFSFEQPNFVYRFVKGETDYMVGSYPTSYFLPEYERRGSRVYEQVLNLTDKQKQTLLALLNEDLKPENRVYRYNYLKDNCATRIRDHIEKATGGVSYGDTIHYGTYRKQMAANHTGYPWYQFGIDLALGAPLDREIGVREEMFTPLEMKRRFDSAKLKDGSPLVAETLIVTEGKDRAVDLPTPWYISPTFIGWLLFFALLFAGWITVKHRKPVKWVYAIYYTVIGLGGCLIAFLVFISVHEATSPNLLLLWLNPLQLLVPLSLCLKRGGVLFRIMMILNLIVVGLMLILWPMGPQSMNPALLPLLLADPVLAGAVLLVPRPEGKKNATSTSRRGTKREKGKIGGGSKRGKRAN